MRAHLTVLSIALSFGGSFSLSPASAEEPNGQPPSEAVETRGRAIDDGYVILDGRYLPPPYVPERRNDDLLINGQLAIRGWFASDRGWPGMFRDESRRSSDENSPPEEGPPPGGFNRHLRPGAFPFAGPRGGPPPGFRGRGSRVPLTLTRIEHHLREGGLLIGGDRWPSALLSSVDAICVLDALLSSDPPDAKLTRILQSQDQELDEDQWKDVIASFEPSAELAARIEPMAREYRQIEAENLARHENVLASAFFMSRPVKYAITLMAMGLVVAACGTLLNYRPQRRARWSEVDREGEGIPIVVRSVVLLVLLGLFDLGCTLIAEQAGGLTELNPLASKLVSSPVSLAGFKLATLLSACAILYALRRYRGAQVAAWWMCLLCTVLTFRWLTYNSMFMT